ncbi:MAG: transporter substrate-binding domain-containing protein [Hyphomicrobiaceae bacterium]
MTIRVLLAAVLVALHASLAAWVCPADAQTKAADRPTLKIATKPTPPFAMKMDNGAWTGLAVELMKDIARGLGKDITWSEVGTTHELLKLAEDGKVDAALAAITITAKREKVVDFSHPYYDSGLAIAVRKQESASFWAGLKALTSPAFLGTVGMLAALLLAAGALVWLVERRRNPDQFHRSVFKGIGSGFWWAAVTMTTVGYGDKAPVTPLGRFIAVIWMFAALILTAVFTAQLTTSLTLNQLSGPVKGFADLSRNRVGVVDKTATRDYFDAQGIATTAFPSIAAGLAAMEANRIDAFVHDEPILRYEVHRNHTGQLEVLADVFDPQVYGIALPSGSALREAINQQLLEVLVSERWRTAKATYFGTEHTSR